MIAGTVNGDGSLRLAVTETGDRTALAGIIRLVEQAQTSHSQAQVVVDRPPYWPTVAALGAFLVIACPHALRLAVPLVVAISTTLTSKADF